MPVLLHHVCPFFQIHAGTRSTVISLPGGSLAASVDSCVPLLQLCTEKLCFCPLVSSFVPALSLASHVCPSPGTQLQSHKNRDRPLFSALSYTWYYFWFFYCWAILVTTEMTKIDLILLFMKLRFSLNGGITDSTMFETLNCQED